MPFEFYYFRVLETIAVFLMVVCGFLNLAVWALMAHELGLG